MSAAGLLGRALLGGVQGAATTAQDVGKQRRAAEREQEVFDVRSAQARAMEKMRAESGMKQAEYEAGQRSEQARLDRESRERIAAMPSKSGKPYLDPMMKARLDSIGSEIDAIYKKEVPEEADRARLTQLIQTRDQMLGMSSPEAPVSAGKPPLADILGADQGEATQKAKPKSLMDRYEAEKQASESAATQTKQTESVDAQLDNIAKQADSLSGVELYSGGGGLFGSQYGGSGQQNAKQHFIRLLEQINREGSPEQRQRAQTLFQQLMGN